MGIKQVLFNGMSARPSEPYGLEHGNIHEEIHREHGLLSNRMNWYVTSQAFLVGAFAVGGESPLSQLIPYIGIVITAIIMLSILGGLLAMWHLRKHDSYKRNCYGAPPSFHWLGIAPLWMIPLVFLGAWIRISFLLPTVPRADIGVSFEDHVNMARLRGYKALSEDDIRKAMDQAYDNYRQGKAGVIVLKLPPKVAK